ncbi:MAG TPA: agmatinase family protein [Actinomycetota bacterium]|nr:agmatinase family protein [Actinomycetota bacterium]
MTDDPNWPRSSAWLSGDRDRARTAAIAVLGVPIRRGSISGGRFDLAPGAVRSALGRFSTWDGERDLGAVRAVDLGDLDVASQTVEEARHTIERSIGEAPGRAPLVLLGGDNSITWAAASALSAEGGPVGLITLDAHHDLRGTDHGISNGAPVRALLEDGTIAGGNVWQIGIQPFANSPAYAAVATDHGIHVTRPEEVRARGIGSVMDDALADLDARCDVIYVDLDVDVLDRAFAPACPGARPGGLLPWEVHEAARLAGAHPKVRAMDLVEIDPERDVADVTVLNAARCLLGFAAGVATRKSAD